VNHNIEWLKKCIEQYRLQTNDIIEAVDDFSEVEKLGQGFTSADPLEEVDIGDGVVPRPTIVNKNLDVETRPKQGAFHYIMHVLN
jgi:hypothetical protein